MRRRLAGIALMVLGAALASMPALPWYAASGPAGTAIEARGLSGPGELWLVPALGGLIVLAGAVILVGATVGARRDGVWAGALALVAATCALAWTLRAGSDPRLVLSIGAPGSETVLPVAAALRPAAVIAPVLAGLAALIAAALTSSALRR